MTTLADFLRDSHGTLWRMYASEDGEIILSDEKQTTSPDDWSGDTYIVPSTYQPTYRTLSDSAGTTWYMYADEGSLALSTTAPSAVAGIWHDCDYGLSETDATVGDEIYLKIEDINGTDYFVYPSTDGEFILTTIEPS